MITDQGNLDPVICEENHMSEKESPQKVIEAHRKRQQMRQGTPMAVMIGAGILLIAGAAALIFWLLGDNSPFKGSNTDTDGNFYTDSDQYSHTLTRQPIHPPSLRLHHRQKLLHRPSPLHHPVHLSTPYSREITWEISPRVLEPISQPCWHSTHRLTQRH